MGAYPLAQIGQGVAKLTTAGGDAATECGGPGIAGGKVFQGAFTFAAMAAALLSASPRDRPEAENTRNGSSSHVPSS